MRVSDCISCTGFPCADVNHEGYVIPNVEVDPGKVSIVLISEAAPANSADYYYAAGNPLYQQTTLQSFQEAGAKVDSFQDILDLGVYLTTAVKCAKIGYGVKVGAIRTCSLLLEQELNLFPNVQVYLLMGDVAIAAVNQIGRREGQGRVIPAGSTYKLRGPAYFFRGKRALPSYLQVGPNYFIEKGKHRVIAEDIAAALRIAQVAK